MKNIAFILALAVASFAQTTVNGNRNFLGSVDSSAATATKPFRIVLSTPSGACTVASEVVQLIASTSLYVCKSDTLTWNAISGAGGAVSSFIGRTGAVVAVSGDYTAAQVTNAADTTASYSNPAWITALAWAKLTGVPSTFTPSAHNHAATDITSLALAAARGGLGTDASGFTGFLRASGGSFSASALVTADLPAVIDFTGKTSTAPHKSGTALPGTCTVGDTFFDTDATAGQNTFGCTATNTWTLQGGSGAGTVTSVATGCGLSGGPITGSGTIVSRSVENAQTGTAYTIDATDCGKLVTTSNGSAITLTIPAAGGSFVDGWYVDVQNIGAGTVTCSGATCTLTTGQSARFVSTGATWRVLLGSGASSSGYATVEVNGSALTQRVILNLLSGTGIIASCVDATTKTNCTYTLDSTVALTRATAQAGTDLKCAGTGTAGAQTCSLGSALAAYTANQVINYIPGTTNTTTQTIDINTLGAKSILKHDGSALAAGDLTATLQYPIWYDGTAFRLPPTGTGGVTSVTGTANEVQVTGTTTPVVSLPSTIVLSGKTVRLPNGTSLPGTCTVGDSFMDTDATSGQRWFLCESTNTWVVQGGGTPAAVQGHVIVTSTQLNVALVSPYISTANRMQYWRFFNPARIQIRYYRASTSASGGAGTQGFALYTVDGNVVANSKATRAAPGINADMRVALPATVTLEVGWYYIGYTSTNINDTLYAAAGSAVSMWNIGESSPNLSWCYGDNLATAGVPPDTIGNQTALGDPVWWIALTY